MNNEIEITQEVANELLRYEKENGLLFWKHRDRKYFTSDHAWKSWNTKHADKRAGSLHSRGYIIISLFSRDYKAHRLIWLMEKGNCPTAEIDHIDHDGTNNRLENLRECSRSENNRNASRRKDNSSGYTGVKRLRGKWQGGLNVNGQQVYIGLFLTPEAASEAVELMRMASKEYHPNHGK